MHQFESSWLPKAVRLECLLKGPSNVEAYTDPKESVYFDVICDVSANFGMYSFIVYPRKQWICKCCI